MEPGGQVLGDHVGPAQLAQRGARVGAGHGGQAGGRRQRDVRARVHAEQPEHPRRGLGQLVIGPGQHGPHVGDRVAGLERVQPAPGVAQFGGQSGQRALGPAGRAADRDAQGQRQAGAGGDDLVRRLGLGRASREAPTSFRPRSPRSTTRRQARGRPTGGRSLPSTGSSSASRRGQWSRSTPSSRGRDGPRSARGTGVAGDARRAAARPPPSGGRARPSPRNGRRRGARARRQRAARLTTSIPERRYLEARMAAL